MNVYLVRRESGCYSDHLSVIEGAFATREAAVRHIESKRLDFFRPDGDSDDLWEAYYGDDEEGSEDRRAGRVVTRSPTRHPSRLTRDRGDPKFDSWYVDHDKTGDAPTWFIDRMEVWGLYRPTKDPFDYTPLFDLQKVMGDEPEVPSAVMLESCTNHPVTYWPVDREGLLEVAKSMVDFDSYRFYDADRDTVSRVDVFEFARQIRNMCGMAGVSDDDDR